MSKIIIVIIIVGIILGLYALFNYIRKNGLLDVFAVIFIIASIYFIVKLTAYVMRQK